METALKRPDNIRNATRPGETRRQCSRMIEKRTGNARGAREFAETDIFFEEPSAISRQRVFSRAPSLRLRRSVLAVSFTPARPAGPATRSPFSILHEGVSAEYDFARCPSPQR